MPRKRTQPASNTLARKIENDPFRESAETDNAKDEDEPQLDYSAGGIDNATDIVTRDDEGDIVPAESTRQKD